MKSPTKQLFFPTDNKKEKQRKKKEKSQETKKEVFD